MPKSNWADPSKKERLGIAAVLKEHLEKEPKAVTVNYTAVADDANRTIEVNSGAAKTVTFPGGVFAAGQKVNVLQAGAGQVTLATSGGLTINSPTTLKTNGQWSKVTLEFRSPTTAVLSGNIAAA
jgi:hypothetical protein